MKGRRKSTSLRKLCNQKLEIDKAIKHWKTEYDQMSAFWEKETASRKPARRQTQN